MRITLPFSLMGVVTQFFKMLNELKMSESVLGSKINLTKSCLFPLDPFIAERPACIYLTDFTSTISVGPIRCSGINFTQYGDDLFTYVQKTLSIETPAKFFCLRQICFAWSSMYFIIPANNYGN